MGPLRWACIQSKPFSPEPPTSETEQIICRLFKERPSCWHLFELTRASSEVMRFLGLELLEVIRALWLNTARPERLLVYSCDPIRLETSIYTFTPYVAFDFELSVLGAEAPKSQHDCIFVSESADQTCRRQLVLLRSLTSENDCSVQSPRARFRFHGQCACAERFFR